MSVGEDWFESACRGETRRREEGSGEVQEERTRGAEREERLSLSLRGRPSFELQSPLWTLPSFQALHSLEQASRVKQFFIFCFADRFQEERGGKGGLEYGRSNRATRQDRRVRVLAMGRSQLVMRRGHIASTSLVLGDDGLATASERRSERGRTSLEVMGETMAWRASRCSSKSSAAALALNSSSQSCDFLISSLMVLETTSQHSFAMGGSQKRWAAHFLSELSSFPPSPASSPSWPLRE